MKGWQELVKWMRVQLSMGKVTEAQCVKRFICDFKASEQRFSSIFPTQMHLWIRIYFLLQPCTVTQTVVIHLKRWRRPYPLAGNMTKTSSLYLVGKTSQKILCAKKQCFLFYLRLTRLNDWIGVESWGKRETYDEPLLHSWHIEVKKLQSLRVKNPQSR